MGGCCSSGRVDSERVPAYLYCPPIMEDHESMSSAHGIITAMPVRVHVGASLDTSSPDTYRAPPMPLPYNVRLPCSYTESENFESGGSKIVHVTSSVPQGLETIIVSGIKASASCEYEFLKVSNECGNFDRVNGSSKIKEVDPVIVVESTNLMLEEDICPICLEEYDIENPRNSTKCEHHFHLSCILEWMERSDACPICDQIVTIDHILGDYSLQ